jgi:hypothetical protein
MAKKEDLIADCILRITRGNPSDDLQIPDSQVSFWLDIVRGRLVAELIKSEAQVNYESFIIEKNNIDIQQDTTKKNNQYYIEIPTPLSFMGDQGIYYVETEGGDEIYRISPHMKSSIKDLRFAKQNRRRSSYFRVGDRLYLNGNSQNFYNNGKINVMIIPEDTSSLEDTDEYPIDSKLLMDLMNGVEDIARRELYGSNEDLSNDGKQQEKDKYQPKKTTTV